VQQLETITHFLEDGQKLCEDMYAKYLS